MLENVNVIAFVATLLVVAGMSLQALRMLRRHEIHKRRMKELRFSAEILDLHQKRLEDFCASDAPDDVKFLLLRMVEAFDDRDAMMKIMAVFEGRVQPSVGPDRDALRHSIDALPPEQRDMFFETVTTALLGTVLRWPETAGCYEELAKVALAARASLVEEATDAYVSIPRAKHQPA